MAGPSRCISSCTKSDFLIEATTADEVAQRLAERNNRPWIPLQWEPETQIRSYDEMAAGSAAKALAFAKRYGSKAANLGFLAHRTVLGRAGTAGTVSNRFGYDLVPDGFGIPLTFYRNLVDHPDNADLRAELDASHRGREGRHAVVGDPRQARLRRADLLPQRHHPAGGPGRGQGQAGRAAARGEEDQDPVQRQRRGRPELRRRGSARQFRRNGRQAGQPGRLLLVRRRGRAGR